MMVITIEHFEVFNYDYTFDALIREALVNEAHFVCFGARFDLGPKLINTEEFFILTAAATNIRVRLFAWTIIIINSWCPTLI
jgi:hypothetical protein